MRRALLACLLFGCGSAAPAPSATRPPIAEAVAAPPAAWIAWQDTRRESLGGEDGWLTLVGLFWLDEPESVIGGDPSSTFVLRGAPPRIGRLVREGDAVRFVAEPGVEVRSSDAPIHDVVLVPDTAGEPTRLEVGSLRMHLVERAGRLGLRVKDRASPARRSFTGVPVFPYDESLVVHARVRAGEGTVPIVNVLGMATDEPIAATFELSLGGREVSLVAIAGGTTPEDGLMVMLHDASADEGETYGAGRYLDLETPTGDEAVIDFNYLYTPPCAFTEHATCPLPPAANHVPFAIRGGERYVPEE